MLSKNDIVKVQLKNNCWVTVKLVSRAGKVGKNRTGKYSNCWNTETVSGSKQCIDFGKDVLKCEVINSNDCTPVEVLFTEAYRSNVSHEVLSKSL